MQTVDQGNLTEYNLLSLGSVANGIVAVGLRPKGGEKMESDETQVRTAHSAISLRDFW